MAKRKAKKKVARKPSRKAAKRRKGSAIDYIISKSRTKAAAGIKPAPPKLLDGVAIGLAVGALIVLVLAKLKPF